MLAAPFNGSRISCAAQRRQPCETPSRYAARRHLATNGAMLGRASCMRLLAGDEPWKHTLDVRPDNNLAALRS